MRKGKEYKSNGFVFAQIGFHPDPSSPSGGPASATLTAPAESLRASPDAAATRPGAATGPQGCSRAGPAGAATAGQRPLLTAALPDRSGFWERPEHWGCSTACIQIKVWILTKSRLYLWYAIGSFSKKELAAQYKVSLFWPVGLYTYWPVRIY